MTGVVSIQVSIMLCCAKHILAVLQHDPWCRNSRTITQSSSLSPLQPFWPQKWLRVWPKALSPCLHISQIKSLLWQPLSVSLRGMLCLGQASSLLQWVYCSTNLKTWCLRRCAIWEQEAFGSKEASTTQTCYPDVKTLSITAACS